MDDLDTLMWHRWCVAEGEKKACEGKKRYKDETAAKRVAVMANRRWRRGDMVPHPCAWCGKWHATRLLSSETRARLANQAPVLDELLRRLPNTAARYAWGVPGSAG